ncbi:MAG TPA: thymidine phosphorylase [Aliiroseovarius sp.]|nr:thymidine phosphorylase [Aliiroseovarius sp.]
MISEIIRHKRDGRALSAAEIGEMVAGITSGAAGDDQVAAFAMAVYFRGMSAEEAGALTLAMRDSGDVFDWPDLPGPVVDKHSTGGVGDNVSLMLAPIVAAAGGYVPMISGRGLGHTGGTLDKMEAIPGYTTQPDNALFARTVREVGCAIIGQTADLAPADKRLYAIRDVTATVESVPLITASILSKKLAAGLGALVMDVKLGNGAFMESMEEARTLADSLIATAGAAGLPCEALLTDMNQPLASAAGNAVEVQNAADFLTGAQRDPRLAEVTLALAARMLWLGGLAGSPEAARARAEEVLDSGAAAERFGRMVAALGGPADFMERPAHYLPAAPVMRDLPAPSSGQVTAIATRDIGLAVIELGGGRRRASDAIDPGVGLTGLLPLGTPVAAGDALCTIHAADEASAARAGEIILAACRIGAKPDVPAPVLELRTAGDGRA